ncbi:MAG: hydrogenase iron-sulfur subunit [Candidatus Hydrothermarchaeales archaeon]
MFVGNTGIFLCNCGKGVDLNFRKLATDLKKIEDVVVVERVDYLCRDDGLAYIVDDFRRKDLERIIVAACSTKNKLFESVATDDLELDLEALEIVDIREQCGWVHEKKLDSTKKAGLLIKNALEKELYLPAKIEVEAGNDILIIGNVEGLRVARDLSKFGADVQLMTEDGYIKKDCNLCLDSQLCEPSTRECQYTLEDVLVHPSSIVTEIEGKIGDFTVNFERGKFIDQGLCLACGKCEEVCEAGAISSPTDSISRVYVIDEEKCNDCEECLKICPTQAINLVGMKGSVKAGQVISFSEVAQREGVYVCKGEDRVELYKNAQAAVFRAILYMEGIMKEEVLEADIEKCANRWIKGKDLDVKGCTICKDSCPYDAIDSGEIDEVLCQSCGICTSVCPQGVVRWKDHPAAEMMDEISRMLDTDIKPKVLMFSCEGCGQVVLKAAGEAKIKYPVAMPISVPCLGSVSDTNILRAFDLGADGVVLIGCRGGKCRHKKGVKAAVKTVNFVKKLLKVLGIKGDRIKMIQADPESPESFVKALSKFTGGLKGLKSPLLKKGELVDIDEVMADEEEKKKNKRDLVHAYVSAFSVASGVKAGSIKGDFPFGDATVDVTKCTICGACGSQCGTGGFLSMGKVIPLVEFTHTYCIGCGICEEICPDEAIMLQKRLDLERFILAQGKEIKVKMAYCEKCGEPIMAFTAFGKLSDALKEQDLDVPKLCQDCLDRANILDLAGIEDSEDVRIFHQGRRPWE